MEMVHDVHPLKHIPVRYLPCLEVQQLIDQTEGVQWKDDLQVLRDEVVTNKWSEPGRLRPHTSLPPQKNEPMPFP